MELRVQLRVCETGQRLGSMAGFPTGLAVDQAGEVGDCGANEIAYVRTYEPSRIAAKHEAGRANGHTCGSAKSVTEYVPETLIPAPAEAGRLRAGAQGPTISEP